MLQVQAQETGQTSRLYAASRKGCRRLQQEATPQRVACSTAALNKTSLASHPSRLPAAGREELLLVWVTLAQSQGEGVTGCMQLSLICSS